MQTDAELGKFQRAIRHQYRHLGTTVGTILLPTLMFVRTPRLSDTTESCNNGVMALQRVPLVDVE